jgi:hypothetical protein
MSAWFVLQRLNGLKCFKKTEIQSITIRDAGENQQAEMMILWQVCEN